MRVLLVKTSSLGDVVHSFPALTDAVAAIPAIRFDWVVEEAFAGLPPLHPAVERPIVIGLRRWRRSPAMLWSGIRPFVASLRAQSYDRVLDAQGLLLKSALPALLARGRVTGFDRRSAREPLAALCYRERYSVPWELHAVERVRLLFAQALGYDKPAGDPDYGLSVPAPTTADGHYVVFLHGTTWDNKHWPEAYWQQLCEIAIAAGFRVRLVWGSGAERERAQRLARTGAEVEPRRSLDELVPLLAGAAGVIGVDSGLTHLATALDRPTLGLYGPTDAARTGVTGRRQQSLASAFACAPCRQRQCRFQGRSAVWPACFAELDPDRVWRQFEAVYAATPRGPH